MFEHGSGRGVEVESGVGMFLEDGGWDERGNGSLDGVFDGGGLAMVRDGADDVFGLHDLADGHGDGSFGDIGQGVEPAFAELLATAGFIEMDDDVGFFGFEIGWGVIEREVSVFTDADEGDINGVFADDVVEAAAFLVPVGVGIDVVEASEWEGELADEALPEVEAEGSGVGDGDGDVFVEVEGGDEVPGDGVGFDELFEHLELRSAGGDDDVGLAALADCVADEFGAIGGGLLSHGRLGFAGDDFHGVPLLKCPRWRLSRRSIIPCTSIRAKGVGRPITFKNEGCWALSWLNDDDRAGG